MPDARWGGHQLGILSAMSPLPTGTLTLLFSDIEGSTSLFNGLGSRWGEALFAQRRILRAAFEAHGGREMGTEGDSFFVVFTSAQEALLAAIEGQRAWLAARLARWGAVAGPDRVAHR